MLLPILNNKLKTDAAAQDGLNLLRPISRRQRLARIAFIFVVSTTLCGFLDVTGIWGFDWLEQYVGQRRTRWQMSRNPAEKEGQRIVLVTFNDETFAPSNLLRVPGPPIPRHYHAQVIRNLKKAGARLIAFDMIFDVSRPAEDAELAAAAKEAGNVVWAVMLDQTWRPVLPNRRLQAASGQYGHIDVPHEADHPDVAYLQAFEKFEGRDVPAFGLKLALLARGLNKEPKQVGNSWRIGDYAIPVDEKGRFAINYSAQRGTAFDSVPYEQIYNPGESAEFYREFFRDKIVLIGSTTKVDNDLQHTPAGNMWGVELHAHALNTLLRQRFVRVSPDWVNLSVICLLAGLISPLSLARRTSWVVWPVIVLFGCYAAANFALYNAGIMLHLVGPAAVIVLTTLSVLVERGWIEEREKERMFDSLVLAAASAIEVRDPTTFGHSQRVTLLTMALARAVNETKEGRFKRTRFSKSQMRELRYATVLHDFGKIGVRESVLLKNHKVDPMYFETIIGRLMSLRDKQENARILEKFEITSQYDGEEASTRLAAIDALLQKELCEIDTDIILLEKANDPTNATLHDEEYVRLKILIEKLLGRTYRDRKGEIRPLLTEAEGELFRIRRGTLTSEEYRQIQQHASMSHYFLQQIPWTAELQQVPDIARSHHEKLNGKGYPLGIRADKIPLQARIMTIADIYDALTAADRPYKKAMPLARALEILRAEAAQGLLDSDLVELFIARGTYAVIENWQHTST